MHNFDEMTVAGEEFAEGKLWWAEKNYTFELAKNYSEKIEPRWNYTFEAKNLDTPRKNLFKSLYHDPIWAKAASPRTRFGLI